MRNDVRLDAILSFLSIFLLGNIIVAQRPQTSAIIQSKCNVNGKCSKSEQRNIMAKIIL